MICQQVTRTTQRQCHSSRRCRCCSRHGRHCHDHDETLVTATNILVLCGRLTQVVRFFPVRPRDGSSRPQSSRFFRWRFVRIHRTPDHIFLVRCSNRHNLATIWHTQTTPTRFGTKRRTTRESERLCVFVCEKERERDGRDATRMWPNKRGNSNRNERHRGFR